MSCTIQGQMLRRSARREVAIYLRGGALWVADFIDGDGEIVDAATWIRFNCASASAWQTRRRMVRECAVPVSHELSSRIELLHRSGAAPSAGEPIDRRDGARARTVRGRIAATLRRLLRQRARYRPPTAST